MPPNWRQGYRTAAPVNGNNLSEDIIATVSGVFESVRIAASDEVPSLFADQPVRDKCSIAIAEDDPAGEQLRWATPADGQDISGPYGGQHTGSVDL
jgi:hypothetical protein